MKTYYPRTRAQWRAWLARHHGTETEVHLVFFKKATGKLAVRSNGSGTIASMTLEYDLKFGPFGKLMDLVMIRSQFQKVLPAVLSGLKKYAESQQAAA